METPVQIDFHDMDKSQSLQEALDTHIRELEDRFGRITAGRVVITGPGRRHRTGGLYDVRIHLSLPGGREVNVDRVDHGDERYSDVYFAVNDAFKRARRRLQDKVRRLQGNTKLHEPQPIGTVARLDPDGEFGFITTPDGREIYFHRNSVLGAFGQLSQGSRVYFAEEEGVKGPQASTVRPAGKHGLR